MIYMYNKVKGIMKWGMMLCLVALMPWQAFATDFTGSGTENSPYLIATSDDLKKLSDQVNAGTNYKGMFFRLETDLDLAGSNWSPIGHKEAKYFAGNFDGNGHTIKNMTISVSDDASTDAVAYGLFGYTKGYVRNLNMTGARITLNTTDSNANRVLRAGLLCGYVGYDISESLYGAIWGCDIAGEITGTLKNSQNNFADTYIGGMVGRMNIPASIYQCHAKVTLHITNGRYVGGIAGYADTSMSPADITDENQIPNSESRPKISYLFDCAADVDMVLSSQSTVSAGGICGANKAAYLLACASSGTMTCQVAADESELGGIAGYNEMTLMSCVSMATITSPYAVGGIVGRNTFNTYTNQTVDARTIINCVYSGHIDCGTSTNAHGIVGVLTAGKATNCLFLGTMTKPSVTPLWNGTATNSKSYFDRNVYDNEEESDESLSFSNLTDGSSETTSFSTSVPVYVDWQRRVNSENTKFDYALSNAWVYETGYYPRLQVTGANIAYADFDPIAYHANDNLGMMYDYVIHRAIDSYIMLVDDEEALHTPKIFPAYAWLASVPVGFTGDGLQTFFLDAPLSLAMKKQDMETVGNVTTMKTARYSLPADQTMLTISGETDAQVATPKVNAVGDVMLTITSTDNISKELCLGVNGSRKWNGKTYKYYDSGNGTEGSPYLIHSARQLIHAFTNNEAGKYYKLKNDIWFNENLLTNVGEPKDGCSKWDHESNRDKNNWYAHLDGDGHMIHGLYSTNAFGLVETMQEEASIENTAFVDCAVKTPETATEGYSGFLTPQVGAKSVIRNCLFNGLYYHASASNTLQMGGLCYSVGGTITANSFASFEDCVVAVTIKSASSDFTPQAALFADWNRGTSEIWKMRHPNITRVLVLNNSHAQNGIANTAEKYPGGSGYFPVGYLPTDNNNYVQDAKTVADMTDGTFFTGEGFEKWKAQQGRFPMLRSFAETAYGKLIALPIYTDQNNRLDNMNYLLDFTPGNASWQTTDNTVLDLDTDIRVLEPKTASSSVYLVRSLDGAKIITPITTAASITAGIKFEDEEAKAFCLAHYDDDHNGEVSLAELKGVLLEEFQEDMNENDGNPDDNDGALIEKFPEFRYFASITDLGTSFQEKDKLQALAFSNKITELSDDDFRGNTSMTSFTIPSSVTTVSGQAFYNSGLENYAVETDHTWFAAVDGLLMNKDKDQLLSFPSGRKGTSITIPDNVKSIGSNAVFKMPEVESVFIDAADYDYETVVELSDNAFTAADGKTITYYIEDATQDYADSDDDSSDAPAFRARRAGDENKPQTTDGKGKGHLVSKYQESDFWTGKTIEPYFKLEVSEKSLDNEGNYWATMYIGFDTELPEGLTAYIVDKEKTKESESTLVLREISNKIRMLTPVVIKATKPGTYTLFASKDSKRYTRIPVYENLLEGVDRNGMTVNQADANDGGCLTLGRNKSGQVGFFIYKGTAKIPAFRAYISVNKVGNAAALTFSYADDETNDIKNVQRSKVNGQWYNIQGQRVGQPSEGIYIKNGRKYVIK